MIRIRLSFLVTLILELTNTAFASVHTPPGLYDVEFMTLQNGLDVILKKRTQAHNVVTSLVVGLGMVRFNCQIGGQVESTRVSRTVN